MSEVKVNKISPRSGTTVTLGDRVIRSQFLVVQQLITKVQQQTLGQQVLHRGQQQLRHQVLQQLLEKDIL
jgi:hypothetical protein